MDILGITMADTIFIGKKREDAWSRTLETQSEDGEEGEDEDVEDVGGGTAGPGLAVLDVPESRALVTVPAGDLGEGVHGGLQTSLHQLLEGVLGQVAGSSVGVTAVQHGVEGVADFSGDEVGSAITSGLQLLLAVHHGLLDTGGVGLGGGRASVPLDTETGHRGGRPLEQLHHILAGGSGPLHSAGRSHKEH